MPQIDEKALSKVIGKAIARLRLAQQMTQEQLAERLGIGSEAVSRLERGVVPPSIGRLVELADIFNCEVTELLVETSPRSSDQAQYLNGLLAPLAEHDRALVLELVAQLAARLAKP